MERQTFWRSGAFKILVFLSGIVILSALLAPPLYFAGKYVVAEKWLEGGFLEGLNGSLDRAKFSRYFNRAVLLGALLLLWPTLKWMNAGRDEKVGIKAFLQLEPNPAWWRHCLLGFVVAGGTLLLLGAFYLNQGWYESRDAGKTLSKILLQALGTGFAVGFLEEFVFRGALQAVLAKVLKPVPLFFTIAIFFAVIHFFNAPPTLEIGPVTWGTGFWMVGRIFQYFFSQFADPYFLLSEFAVLFAIGLVLGYTRMKTGSLWLGIGLHAGWVFGVKTLSPMTSRAFERAEMMPWLGDTLRVGLVSTIIVLLTGAGVWLFLRKSPRDPFAETEK
ncbi:MAG: CPBP family intramembrane metalloprotease [Verrucomicrobiales bacterium]|nr:CPBP family intramembrane metalloprotease [Verrucomicrobiales bacterium]